MSADDNDIRAALGMIVRNQEDLARRIESFGDRLDDLGAVAARAAQLVELVDDTEAMLSAIPNGLRRAATDPTIGMLLGGQLTEMADGIEQALAARRTRRGAAPSVERG